jgi:hypothetical protein
MLSAAVVLASCLDPPDSAKAQTVAGVSVHIDVLKRSSYERGSTGPVLVGPQSAFELEWTVHNSTGEVLHISSPGAILALRVSRRGRRIPVGNRWAADMTLQSRMDGTLVRSTLPLGPVAMPEGSSLSVRGSTIPTDGSVFAAGEYVLDLEFTPPPQASANRRIIDRVFPIDLRIVGLDTLERRRQFHIIEGAFYRNIDKNRALEHYVALTSLPGAQWSDALALAAVFGELGRHGEACVVYRRILPDLIGALDAPVGIVRTGRYLRTAALSFAVEGDVSMAARLLRLEGYTPEVQIPAEIEKLRRSAPRRGHAGHHRLTQVDFALLRELHHRSGGNVFGDGSDGVHRAAS